MKKSVIPITIIVPIIVIAIVSIIAIIVGKIVEINMPSKIFIDPHKYYDIREGEARIVLDEEEKTIRAMVKEDVVYLPLELSREFLPRIYYDNYDNIIIYTTATEKYIYNIDEEQYTENGNIKRDSTPSFIEKGGNIFVNLKFIEDRYDFFARYIKDLSTVVIFNEDGGRYDFCILNEAGYIRTNPDEKAPILREGSVGDKLYLLEGDREKTFQKIMTEDGIIGYIDIKKLPLIKTETESFSFDRKDRGYTSLRRDEKIVMVWHQVGSAGANNSVFSLLTKARDVNVVSPTWFSISDSKGEISSLATEEYVTRLHNQGIEVWPLINDFNKEVDYRELFLSNTNRTNLINNILYFLEKYKLDGINIDFENINSKFAKGYIEFLRELSIVMRNKKKVLSIDNYIPMEFNSFYDIKEQGLLADYICVMAYDEHYQGSKKAGSVSSLNWVKKGIKNTAKDVDKEKIIVGLPFYTRIWREKKDGNITSEALSMNTGINLLKNKGIKASFDEETGQYYAEWKEDKDVLKIWLEEEESIAKKLSLIKDDLAGLAFWKLGLERDEVWQVINNWNKK